MGWLWSRRYNTRKSLRSCVGGSNGTEQKASTTAVQRTSWCQKAGMYSTSPSRRVTRYGRHRFNLSSRAARRREPVGRRAIRLRLLWSDRARSHEAPQPSTKPISTLVVPRMRAASLVCSLLARPPDPKETIMRSTSASKYEPANDDDAARFSCLSCWPDNTFTRTL